MLVLFVTLCIHIDTKAQWLPTGTSTSADIYRTGKVNIGGSAALTATSPLLSLTSTTTSTVPSLSIVNGNVVFSGTGTAAVPIAGGGTRLMWVPKLSAFRAGFISTTNSTYWDYANMGDYSQALGYDVKASGVNSVAIGTNLESTGGTSFTLGYNVKATGVGAMAIGTSTLGGTNSTASSLMMFFNNTTPSLFVHSTGTAINKSTVTTGVALDVNGKTKTTTLQVGSSATVGHVLTADASGNASWAAASGGSGGTAYTAGTGLSITGTTINSVFTTTGTNIKNNNTGHVHFFDGSTATTSKVIIGGGISNASTTSTSGIPGSYRLYVQGGILTERLKVATLGGANWADYVFAKDYKLKPLAEVEAYINENKHLPNIPAAVAVENGGFDVAEMATKQMEKIEELTLYIIALDKKNKELEIKINNLIKAK
jgi:hypothetical protein